MYFLPREHVTPHRSLQITSEHKLHTDRTPGDLLPTFVFAFYLLFVLSTWRFQSLPIKVDWEPLSVSVLSVPRNVLS